ncbi:MAG: SpvB/TcaC N-terminal domain-containing protein, partial [Woeseiaceae bacterium]
MPSTALFRGPTWVAVLSILASLSHEASAVELIGAVNGQPGTSGGNASYSIPIAVPPGRNGMEPSLSLNYNSGSGNGLLGVGWSLGGMAAITRCSANWAQDGFSDGVEFDGQDRYCLNGQRLILKSGSYGAAGSVYSTEIDSFVKVTAYGQQGSGPSYWVVHDKNGMRHWYGSSTSSRVEAQGKPDALKWALFYSIDRFSNHVIYSYGENNATGEHYPTKVTYTRHKTQNAGSDRTVHFVYEQRADAMTAYTHGSKQFTTKRLKRVYTQVGTQKAREYRMRYGTSAASGRTLMLGVTECAYQPSMPEQCLPETTFDWDDGATNFQLQTTLPGGNGGPALYDHKRFAQADLNGDGHNDLIRMGGTTYGATNGQVEVYWGSSAGFQRNVYSMTADGWGPANNSPTIDYNNDGKTDLTVVRHNGSQLTVHAISYEVNGNTLVPIVFDTGVPVDGNNPVYGIEKPSGGAFSTMTYTVLDVNGDGLHDIVTRDQVNSSTFQLHTYLRRSNPDDFARVGTATNAVSTSAMFPMDLDGDGQTDLVVEDTGPYSSTGRSKSFRTLISTGAGFYERSSPLPVSATWKVWYEGYQYTTYDGAASPTFIDVNGDGLLDVLMPYAQLSGNRSTGNLRLYINEGDGFTLAQTLTRPVTNTYFEDLAPYMLSFDYNRDGNTDLIFPATKTISAPGTCIPVPGGPGGGGGIPFSVPDPVQPQPSSPKFSATSSLPAQLTPVQQPALPLNPDDQSAQLNNGNVDCQAGAKNDHDGYQWHVYLSNGQTLNTTAINTGITATLRGMTVIDLDADSLPDIYADKPPTSAEINNSTGVFPTPRPVQYFVNQAPMTDLLTSATDGLNKVVEFDYAPLTDDSVYELHRTVDEDTVRHSPTDNISHAFPTMPFASTMRVLKEMRVSDGLAGSGMNKTRMKYENARYDLQGRGFLGFETVITSQHSRDSATSTERQISRTVAKHHQHYPFIGRVHDVKTFLGNETNASRYRSQVTTVWWQSVGQSIVRNYLKCTDQASPQCSNVSKTDRLKHFPFPKTVTERINEPEASPAGATYQQITLKTTTNTFDLYGNKTNETVVVEDKGAEARTRLTTTTINTYTPADETNWWVNRLSQTQVTKDVDHLVSPAPSSPAQTRTISYLYYSNRNIYRITQHPNDAKSELVTTFTYDIWGNQLTQQVSSPVTGERSLPTRTTSTGWSSDKYFPATLTNAVGHLTNLWHDPLTGKLAIVTDPNGVTTSTDYDNFGRPTSVQVDGSAPVLTNYASPASWCPSSAEYMVNVTQVGRPSNATCFDKLNRAVKTRTQAFAPGQWNYTHVEYTPRGNVYREAEPYGNSGATHYTTFTGYDDLGRPGQKISPNGMTATYEHQGLKSRITVNGGGNLLTMHRWYNSLGQLVRTDDAMGGLTRYRFDGFGNPVLIKGPTGNDITATYNNAGHKETMSDPDRGAWSFVTDPLGQVKRQTDAKNQVTKFSHDLLGRVYASYENTGGADQQVGQWTFDGPNGVATAPYIGKPYSVDGITGQYAGYEQQYSYDNYGRPASTTTMINDGTINASFQMSTAYDAQGRLSTLTYPTGFSVTNSYNAQGYLHEQRDGSNNNLYKKVTAMNARNQVLSQQLGWAGKLYNARDYVSSTGQLAVLCTMKTTISSTSNCNSSAVQELTYTYDAFQNMASRSNTPSGIKEVFDNYDDLHRLTASHMEHIAGGSGSLPAALSYSYDAQGNFLS